MSERPSSFDYEAILSCARGELFGPGNAQLPMPPMLMVDRITEISASGGNYGRGRLVAEFDISPDRWFFPCHFIGDPVMPGCLGLDAMWQLVGFFLAWMGAPGRGRALGVGDVSFRGQVFPSARILRYEIEFKKVIMRKLVLGVADGVTYVDGTAIYAAKDLKVGLFKPEDSAEAPE